MCVKLLLFFQDKEVWWKYLYRIIYRRSIAALIRNLEILVRIFGRMYAWVMAMHSLSKARKWESKKSRNRLRLELGVTYDEDARVRVYAILRVYMWHIVFAGALLWRGSLYGARFAPLILLTLFIFRFRIHPSRPPNSQFHEWALLCYDAYHGADSYGAPCHGFGRKRYYFSQFAKQMLPIVKPPPLPPVPLRCLGFIFPARFRQSPTLRYFAFVRAVERIFLRANPCNREIFISVYRHKDAKEEKREIVCAIYMHIYSEIYIYIVDFNTRLLE